MPVRSQQIQILVENTAVPLVVPTYGSVGDPITATIRNLSSTLVYLGGEDVSTTNGFPLRDGEVVSLDLIAGDVVYALIAIGASQASVAVLKFRQ